MRITRAEIATLALPFRFEFRHARASRSEGASVLVRLVDDDGREGHGECAPREYVTGESVAQVRETLVRDLLPPFVGARLPTFDTALAALAEVRDRTPRERLAAFCALELAVLDLAARAECRAAADIFGPIVRPELRYGAVVSAGGLADALATCRVVRGYGFDDVKLKVGLSQDADLAVLRGARAVLGPSFTIRVDANGAWRSPEEALRQLEAFAAHGVAAAEQPLRAGEIDDLAWLTARSPIPIVADESVASYDDAVRLAERRACHVFNVRVSKCGGLVNAARIVEVGRRADIGWMLGAQVGESAILSAAGRQLASRVEGARWLEGSYGTLLLEEDVGVQDLTLRRGGGAPALPGPGLGVELDSAVVARHARERVLLEAT